jgi:hypothetical protein
VSLPAIGYTYMRIDWSRVIQEECDEAQVVCAYYISLRRVSSFGLSHWSSRLNRVFPDPPTHAPSSASSFMSSNAPSRSLVLGTVSFYLIAALVVSTPSPERTIIVGRAECGRWFASPDGHGQQGCTQFYSRSLFLALLSTGHCGHYAPGERRLR